MVVLNCRGLINFERPINLMGDNGPAQWKLFNGRAFITSQSVLFDTK